MVNATVWKVLLAVTEEVMNSGVRFELDDSDDEDLQSENWREGDVDPNLHGNVDTETGEISWNCSIDYCAISRNLHILSVLFPNSWPAKYRVALVGNGRTPEEAVLNLVEAWLDIKKRLGVQTLPSH